MVSINPVLPDNLLVLYYCISTLTLTFCSVALLAISRTKKTPYSAKLLSMGLLCFDILFLLSASVSKLFKPEELFIIQQLTRGFQISAQIVIVSMSFERLFVLNWPYVYLRVATKRRVRLLCGGIFILSFLQYVAFRGSICYARNMPRICGLPVPVYFFLLSLMLPMASFASYMKIYKIIRNSATKQPLRQYKGTLVSFLFLVNSVATLLILLGISLYNIFNPDRDKGNGYAGALADFIGVINCIIDPSIYVVWFKEARFEILKMVGGLCPRVYPVVQKMYVDIYNIEMYRRSELKK